MNFKEKTNINLANVVKVLCTAFLASVPVVSMAELSSMNDDALAKTQGQAGVNIGLDMVINKVDNDNTKAKDCAENSGRCQFGMKFDNQNNPDLWLTFTGVSGGLKIPKLNIQSVETQATANTPAKSAVQFTLANEGANKVVFSDFGFDSLRLSKDTVVNGEVTSGGYRNAVPFATGAGTGVDAGRQPGFLGVRINGAASITGSVTMFDCGSC